MSGPGRDEPDRPPALRSFKRRASRVTPGQADAIGRLWPTVGVVVDGRALDLAALFGRQAPVVLEIGFGMGEATAAMAAAQPDLDVIAVDVHTPGHGALLRAVDERGLSNVRVADGDATMLLDSMLPAASLAAVRVFFPDPWPKRRHWKRRLVSTEFLDLVADRLLSGGVLHVATDWPPYAEQVSRLLDEHPRLEPVADPPWRAPTRFEAQGVAAGRPAADLAALRR